MVEQHFCKVKVAGSIPSIGSISRRPTGYAGQKNVCHPELDSGSRETLNRCRIKSGVIETRNPWPRKLEN